MRRNWKLEVLIAALVLLLAVPLLLAGGGKDENQKVTVMSGTDVQQLRLEDFKDGETKTIKGADGEMQVTRHGDQLKISLKGEQIVTSGKDERAFIMTTSSDSSAKVRHWITMTSGDDGDTDVETYFVSGEDGKKIELKDLPVWVAKDDSVLYRCPKDGAELRVPKKDAGKNGFTCPVCGTVMTKVETHVHMKKTVTITVDGDDDAPEK
jgi:hypothetical protein